MILSDFYQNVMYLQILVKVPSIKINGDLFSYSGLCYTCTDRQSNLNRCSTGCQHAKKAIQLTESHVSYVFTESIFTQDFNKI
jgi:hypothetical protein